MSKFCEMNGNINHIAEVSTSRKDGSPTGAEILTSTNVNTGDVRDTLDGKLSKMGAEFDIAQNNWNAQFNSQFIYKNGGEWADAPAQITDAEKLTYWTVANGDGYAVKGSVTLPITKPVSPVDDDDWFIANAVNVTKMRTDSASQFGLVYLADWAAGLAIPDGAMTAKLAVWHDGQFYSVGTDARFTSNAFDADLGKGWFVSALTATTNNVTSTFNSVSDVKNVSAGCFVKIISATSAWAITAPFYPIGGGNYVVSNDTANGMNILDAGSGLTITLIHSGEVSLDQLYCSRSGDVDVTPFLEQANAINAKIKQCGGSFLVATDYKLVTNNNIQLLDGAEFVRTTVAKFKAGDRNVNTSLTASGVWNIGSRLITLDTASYATVNVGDKLYIQNKTPDNADYILDFVANPNDLNNWIYQVQAPIISEKLAGNVIKVSQAAKMPYNFDTVAKIVRLDDYVENVRINATFRNQIGMLLGSESCWMNTTAMFGINLAGSIFNLNRESGGFYIQLGLVKSVAGCTFNDGAYLDIFIRQDCPYSQLYGAEFNGHMRNDASIFIEAHNYSVVVHGNTFNSADWDDTKSVISAIQMDAKVNNCSITCNQIFGYPVGLRMELGCFGNSVTGNTFQLCSVSGIREVDTRGNTITSNTFLDCGLSNNSQSILSQQQGAIYVNGVQDTIHDNNIMQWTNPLWGNFQAALSGSMSTSTFRGNEVVQCKRAVWLLDPSAGNDISDNPNLELYPSTGDLKAIVISGARSHKNKVNRNGVNGGVVTGDYAITFEDGSEGNEALDNQMNDFTYGVGLLNTSKYQSINGNKGDFARFCNVDIAAPVMPAHLAAEAGFTIHSVSFDMAGHQGSKRWVYISGTSFSQQVMTATTVTV